MCRTGLHQLRKSIAIIPQEPNLFEGTVSGIYLSTELFEGLGELKHSAGRGSPPIPQVRSNLDWLQEHTDGSDDTPLWEVRGCGDGSLCVRSELRATQTIACKGRSALTGSRGCPLMFPSTQSSALV